jgi:hypothetical protein
MLRFHFGGSWDERGAEPEALHAVVVVGEFARRASGSFMRCEPNAPCLGRVDEPRRCLRRRALDVVAGGRPHDIGHMYVMG